MVYSMSVTVMHWQSDNYYIILVFSHLLQIKKINIVHENDSIGEDEVILGFYEKEID